jgi:O-antigen/teichoic acid export membrane protein
MSIKSQTAWNTLPLIAITFANLLSVPLFYRYLGAERYGLWFQVLTLSGAFGFMDLGLGVAVGRYVGLALGNKDHKAVREYWGTGNVIAIPLLVLMSLGFCAIGAIFGPQWFQIMPGMESLFRWCFFAAAPGLFLSYYGQFWNILAQAHLDFRFLAAARTVTAVGSLAVAVILAKSTGSPLMLIWWSTLVATLQLFIFVYHSFRNYGLHWNLSDARWARASEMTSYTVKTFLLLLLSTIAGTVDRLVLGKLVPTAQFAHFAIANNVGLRMQGLGAAVLGPVFHQSNRAGFEPGRDAIRRIHAEAFSLVFGWCLLSVAVSALWSVPLLRMWLGEALSEVVAPLFLPVVLACSILVMSSISGAQLASLDRQGTLVGFQLARVSLAVIGGLAGWKFGGLPGFAWGVLLSRIADIGQDLLLTSMVGPVAWMTVSSRRTLMIQAGITSIFLAIGVFSTDWRIRAFLGILHLACGAIPLLNTWMGAGRSKAVSWSSKK